MLAWILLRIVLLNILVGVLSESYSAGYADRRRLFLTETWPEVLQDLISISFFSGLWNHFFLCYSVTLIHFSQSESGCNIVSYVYLTWSCSSKGALWAPRYWRIFHKYSQSCFSGEMPCAFKSFCHGRSDLVEMLFGWIRAQVDTFGMLQLVDILQEDLEHV